MFGGPWPPSTSGQEGPRRNFVTGTVPEHDPAYDRAAAFGMNPRHTVLLKALPGGHATPGTIVRAGSGWSKQSS